MSESAWRVIITPRAEKDLRRVHPGYQPRIRQALDALSIGPTQGDFRKLRGFDDEWRRRVGEWRIRFRPDFDRRTLVVTRILPRGSAYRD